MIVIIQEKYHFGARDQSTKFMQDTSIYHFQIALQYFILSQDLGKICLSNVQLVGNIKYCSQYVVFLHARSFFRREKSEEKPVRWWQVCWHNFDLFMYGRLLGVHTSQLETVSRSLCKSLGVQ